MRRRRASLEQPGRVRLCITSHVPAPDCILHVGNAEGNGAPAKQTGLSPTFEPQGGGHERAPRGHMHSIKPRVRQGRHCLLRLRRRWHLRRHLRSSRREVERRRHAGRASPPMLRSIYELSGTAYDTYHCDSRRLPRLTGCKFPMPSITWTLPPASCLCVPPAPVTPPPPPLQAAAACCRLAAARMPPSSRCVFHRPRGACAAGC